MISRIRKLSFSLQIRGDILRNYYTKIPRNSQILYSVLKMRIFVFRCFTKSIISIWNEWLPLFILFTMIAVISSNSSLLCNSSNASA